MKKEYRIVSKFECYGKNMVTVRIEGRAVCVMSEIEYRNIIKLGRKSNKENKLKESA